MTARQPIENGPARRPAVAGQFYPDDAAVLQAEVKRYLAEARRSEGPLPKAVIAPHAGYMYSGPVAGSAYARLAEGRTTVKRVVLLGPSHFVSFRGVALSSAVAFDTPLGPVPVDQEALAEIRSLEQVTALDSAHSREHSLEVHLPFLQTVLADFRLVPLLAGEASTVEVSQVLEQLWGGPETCIVVSSDLSHFLDYRSAQRLDRAAAQAIQALDPDRLSGDQACGCRPVRGLLRAAGDHGLRCQVVDLRNSGDTAGRHDRVVGYGAFLFIQR
jgi:hypothetical protein